VSSRDFENVESISIVFGWQIWRRVPLSKICDASADYDEATMARISKREPPHFIRLSDVAACLSALAVMAARAEKC